jgi:Kef-type K+ transport system membrane component KefB
MIAASIRAEPMFGFMVIALIIIFGPLVAQKLRLPGLIGLLIGGALIGPNMFGVLESTEGIEAFGDIGVLYLIFLAGLNLDMKTLSRYRSVTVQFGLITATIPWVLGWLVAASQGYDGKTAVLIGSFWASFTLVSYGVITQYGLTRNPSMAATVGASSITDTIGLVALALIVGSETGDASTLVLMAEIVGGLIVVAVYCILVFPAITRWFFAGLGQERELRFMMVVAGFTSAAVIAETVGIEPLIGAFFAGLGLNSLIPNNSQLMARTDFFGNALFIPAFLISVGLLVDPSVMFSGPTLRLALGLSVALIVGKSAAAWITGRVNHFSRAEVGLMFSLSAAQAAATLASTIIGLEAGLYGDEVVNAVMIVIVISLFVSSLGSSYFAPQVVPAATSERRLGQNVVVPVQPVETFTNSLWLAGAVAGPDGGVILPLSVAVTDDPDSLEHSRDQVASVRTMLRGLGLTGDPELRVDRSVAGGVDRYALEHDASLVLLTWPGPRDFRSYLLGASSDEIAAATDRPIAVAVVPRSDFERVLIVVPPADMTPAGMIDARMAVAMATNVASSSKLAIVFGPADRDHVEAIGLDLPTAATHLAGPDDVEGWLDANVLASDLVLLSGGENPFTVVERLAVDDRSMVAIANHQEAGWYSPEGTLGVTTQRR